MGPWCHVMTVSIWHWNKLLCYVYSDAFPCLPFWSGSTGEWAATWRFKAPAVLLSDRWRAWRRQRQNRTWLLMSYQSETNEWLMGQLGRLCEQLTSQASLPSAPAQMDVGGRTKLGPNCVRRAAWHLASSHKGTSISFRITEWAPSEFFNKIIFKIFKFRNNSE